MGYTIGYIQDFFKIILKLIKIVLGFFFNIKISGARETKTLSVIHSATFSSEGWCIALGQFVFVSDVLNKPFELVFSEFVKDVSVTSWWGTIDSGICFSFFVGENFQGKRQCKVVNL